MKSCKPCGLCTACLTSHKLLPAVVNPQCHRRHLRPRRVVHHACFMPCHYKRRRACSKYTCPKSGSVVTEMPIAVKAEAVRQQCLPAYSDTSAYLTGSSQLTAHRAHGQVSGNTPSQQPPAKIQGFAGLGAQRTLDFLSAWDQLALRLPPQVFDCFHSLACSVAHARQDMTIEQNGNYGAMQRLASFLVCTSYGHTFMIHSMADTICNAALHAGTRSSCACKPRWHLS